MSPVWHDVEDDDREVNDSAEAEERWRTAPVAHDFVAEVSADHHKTLVRWQDEQHSLWNRALAERLQAEPQIRFEHEENNAEQLRWLTDERAKHAALRAVPRIFQQDLLHRLNRELERYYFGGGEKPRPWRNTTAKWALISCGAVPGVVILGEGKIKLPKLGTIMLRGAEPLPADSTLRRFSIARNGDQWDVRIYAGLAIAAT